VPATNTSTSSTPILGRLQSINPFGKDGFIRLPIYENEAPGAPLPARNRREEEEGWFARKSARRQSDLRSLSVWMSAHTWLSDWFVSLPDA